MILAGRKLHENVCKTFNLGGNFHDTSTFSLIKAYGFNFPARIISTSKAVSQKMWILPSRQNFHVHSNTWDVCKTLTPPSPTYQNRLARWPLNYWPEYQRGSSSHQGLSIYQVWRFCGKASLIYSLHKLCKTNIPTDWPTYRRRLCAMLEMHVDMKCPHGVPVF